MDFFQHQDDARKRTRWMIVMFIISAVMVVAAVDLVAYGVLFYIDANPNSTLLMDGNGSDGYGNTGGYQPSSDDYDPKASDYLNILSITTLVTTLVIILGTWYKIAELSSGGQAVAEMLGAKRISPSTKDFAERRLLNIVEEMALASGVPVPPVYLMNENCINAFAAGYTPDDAVVSVTRGALNTLTRDELQGVVAHEFSHILNGDMRLNIRMMGILNGILVISLIGQIVFRCAISSGSRSSKDSGDGRAALALIGLVVMIIGYVGWFLGNFIRMAVSRQREYLADASAVQFTRNPEGIGNALIKIGAISNNERAVKAPAANEVDHMFIANASGFLGAGLLATHPPLAKRVKQILPNFDGKFPPISSLMAKRLAEEEAFRAKQATSEKNANKAATARRIAMVAVALDEVLTPELKQTSTELLPAVALTFATLLEPTNQELRAKQCQILRSSVSPQIFAEFERLVPQVETLQPSQKYLLLECALPTLKQLSKSQYEQVNRAILNLLQADSQIDLNEYIIQAKLLRQLDLFYGKRQASKIRFTRWGAVAQQQAALVLSRLAYDGSDDPAEQTEAFQKGAKVLGNWPGFEMLKKDQCGLKALSTALEVLDSVSPPMKKLFLNACQACVMSDNQLVESEKQLLHAISSMLGIPCPLLTPEAPAETKAND